MNEPLTLFIRRHGLFTQFLHVIKLKIAAIKKVFLKSFYILFIWKLKRKVMFLHQVVENKTNSISKFHYSESEKCSFKSWV